MVTRWSRTSPRDGCLPWGCTARGPPWHLVQQHELAGCTGPSWLSLSPCGLRTTCQMDERVRGRRSAPSAAAASLPGGQETDGLYPSWETLRSQPASPRGHHLQAQWLKWGALWLVWASLLWKKWNPNPQAYLSSLSSGTSRKSSLLMNFFLCNSNQNKKNST